MLCPLCYAEYPSGATQCESCRAPLVGGREAAEAERMELWSGEDRQRFDDLLAALERANIASYGEERSEHSANRFRLVPMHPGLLGAVWVLRKDAERAEEIFREVEQAEEARDPDADEGGGK